MTTFRRGDIVRQIKPEHRFDITGVGTTHTVWNESEHDGKRYLSVAGLRVGGKSSDNFELIYRPPTREEVEDLRSRVAELEAALRPFAEANGKFDVLYKHLDTARKVMGLEG